MRIKSITIDKLFGYFDHVVKLKTKDRITILHGPNGVGKTTILRLVHDLFEKRFSSMFATPFERMVIGLSPKGTLTVVKKNGPDGHTLPQIILTYRAGNEKVEHTVGRVSKNASIRHFPLSVIQQIDPSLDRIGPEEWLDRRTGRVLALEEVVLRFGDRLPVEIRELVQKLPPELLEVLSSISVSLIETQRLFTEFPRDAGESRRKGPDSQPRMTVEEYSQDMVSNIQQRLRDSGSLTASLDREFPQRLLETRLPGEATEENIRKLYGEQADYRNRLMQAGLIDAEKQVSLPSGQIGEMERKVLWIYLNDVQKKLKIFDSLLARVELLRDIINKRFQYKELKVRKEEGFAFISNHDKSPVPLTALSSGEQHELVLSYDLLFKVKKNSLVFIDEPELSLHVSWQRKFLEDIGRISELADLDFVIATHSPSIIHNRRDLMVGLPHNRRDLMVGIATEE
jgi:predicted ATP-binding protein involved in virulence